jgi:hypothetical protein
MNKFTQFLFLCALLIALATLVGFWPGKYQFYTTQSGILIRVNRYSGETEHYIYASGWTASAPSNPLPAQGGSFGSPTPAPTKGR